MGLRLLLLAIIYMFILFEYYADIYLYYYERLLAPMVTLALIEIFGKLRYNLDAIKEANLKLDHLVAERTAELQAFAAKLIQDSEEVRISQGQLLHDGIGQHMTGIQLYCASLADQLLEEHNPSVSIAHSLRNRGRVVHNQIRQLARMLFPVKIGEVGLIPALHELASCFMDFEHVQFDIKEIGELPELPEEIALQLYRICQENANHAVYHLQATRIAIKLHATETEYTLKFFHNGMVELPESKENILNLTSYRLQQISGASEIAYSMDNNMRGMLYLIPQPRHEVQR